MGGGEENFIEGSYTREDGEQKREEKLIMVRGQQLK
jgi:hypothetical protein